MEKRKMQREEEFIYYFKMLLPYRAPENSFFNTCVPTKLLKKKFFFCVFLKRVIAGVEKNILHINTTQ